MMILERGCRSRWKNAVISHRAGSCSMRRILSIAVLTSVMYATASNVLAEDVKAAVAHKEITPPIQVAAKIDGFLESHWSTNKVTPAKRAEDATFLRRITLDLTYQRFSKRTAVDPKGPTAKGEGQRAVRGGSWLSPVAHNRCANRAGYWSRDCDCDIGFRVVTNASPSAK
jgi:hypothetical protein